jgi:hypothetical protein
MGIHIDEFHIAALHNNGNTNMAVDGSVTPVEFIHTIEDGNFYQTGTHIVIQGDGEILAGAFGDLKNGLTNGILHWVTKSNGDPLQQFPPIVRNSQFGWFAGANVRVLDRTALLVEMNSHRATGGRTLDYAEGDTFRVLIRDDLSDLTSMQWLVVGVHR